MMYLSEKEKNALERAFSKLDFQVRQKLLSQMEQEKSQVEFDQEHFPPEQIKLVGSFEQWVVEVETLTQKGHTLVPYDDLRKVRAGFHDLDTETWHQVYFSRLRSPNLYDVKGFRRSYLSFLSQHLLTSEGRTEWFKNPFGKGISESTKILYGTFTNWVQAARDQAAQGHSLINTDDPMARRMGFLNEETEEISEIALCQFKETVPDEGPLKDLAKELKTVIGRTDFFRNLSLSGNQDLE